MFLNLGQDIHPVTPADRNKMLKVGIRRELVPGIQQFHLRHIDAGKRHASYCDRPICEHDVSKSAQLWEKSANLWDWIMKSAHLWESAQLWETAYLGELAQL